MKIAWDELLERIRQSPPEHLGSFSPSRLRDYFWGYSQALSIHDKPVIEGEYGLRDFNDWFVENAYAGPQGWSNYCLLLTNTPEGALDLFFEFRKIAKKSGWKNKRKLQLDESKAADSPLALIRSASFRKRPVLYFGNGEWVPSIWAFWNGYVWAENDIGNEVSHDRDTFVGFERWLQTRYEFAQESNFGKLFDFLALGNSEKALENLYDHLDIFMDGAPSDAPTKGFQSFLDEVVASASKEQEKQGTESDSGSDQT